MCFSSTQYCGALSLVNSRLSIVTIERLVSFVPFVPFVPLDPFEPLEPFEELLGPGGGAGGFGFADRLLLLYVPKVLLSSFKALAMICGFV